MKKNTTELFEAKCVYIKNIAYVLWTVWMYGKKRFSSHLVIHSQLGILMVHMSHPLEECFCFVHIVDHLSQIHILSYVHTLMKKIKYF